MKYGKYKIRKYAMIKFLTIVFVLIVIGSVILGTIYLIENIKKNKNNEEDNINIYSDKKSENLISKKTSAGSSSDNEKKVVEQEVISPKELDRINEENKKAEELLISNSKKAVELAGGEETGNLKRRVAYVEEIKGLKYYVVQVYEVITGDEKSPNQMLTIEWVYIDIDNNKTYKKDIMTNELIDN